MEEVIGLLIFQDFPERYWGRNRRLVHRRVNVQSLMPVYVVEHVASFLEEVRCFFVVVVRLARQASVRLILPRVYDRV